MLLLLEGDREKPQQFSPDDPEKFIVELQLACTQDKQLAQAREQAEATGVIMAAKAQERAKAATPPTHAAEREFMLQLYELNAGLLA